MIIANVGKQENPIFVKTVFLSLLSSVLFFISVLLFNYNDLIANIIYVWDHYVANSTIGLIGLVIFLFSLYLMADLIDKKKVPNKDSNNDENNQKNWTLTLLGKDITGNKYILIFVGIIFFLSLVSEVWVIHSVIVGRYLYSFSFPFILTSILFLFSFILVLIALINKMERAKEILIISQFLVITSMLLFSVIKVKINNNATGLLDMLLLKCGKENSGKNLPYSAKQLELYGIFKGVLYSSEIESEIKHKFSPNLILAQYWLPEDAKQRRIFANNINYRIMMGSVENGMFGLCFNVLDLLDSLNKKTNYILRSYFYKTPLDPYQRNEYLFPFLQYNQPIFSLSGLDPMMESGKNKELFISSINWVGGLLLAEDNNNVIIAEQSTRKSFKMISKINSNENRLSQRLKKLKSIIFQTNSWLNIIQKIRQINKKYNNFESTMIRMIENGDISAFLNALRYYYIKATIEKPDNPNFEYIFEVYKKYSDKIKKIIDSQDEYKSNSNIQILENEIETIYLCAQKRSSNKNNISAEEAISRFYKILSNLKTIRNNKDSKKDVINENIYIIKNDIQFIKLSKTTLDYNSIADSFAVLSEDESITLVARAKSFFGRGVALLKIGQQLESLGAKKSTYIEGINSFKKSFIATRKIYNKYQVDEILTRIENIDTSPQMYISLVKNDSTFIADLIATHKINFAKDIVNKNRHDDLLRILNDNYSNN